MITWQNIKECFSKSEYVILKECNLEQEYWNEKILYKNMTASDTTILYIVKSSNLFSVKFESEVAVIILQDDEHEIEIPPENTGNVLWVKKQEEVFKGIVELDSKFEDQFKVGYILSKLQNTIVNNEGLSKVIEIISDFFKEPVSLLDTTFRFIAKSESYKPDYNKSLFPDIHDEEGFDKKVIDLFRKEGVLDKLIHSTKPFSYTGASEKSYFIPIVISNIKVAYLIIYSNNPDNKIGEQYETFFPLFSNMLSIEMAKDNFYLFNKGNYYNYIFSLLLTKESVDIEDIRMRLQIYNYDLRDYIYLIEIDTDMYRNISIHKDRIADSIRKIFRNSFYVFKNDKIYFLISRSKSDLITGSEMDSWEMALKNQKLNAAITGPFTDFSDMQEHIREVQLVLESIKGRKQKKHVFSFEEYQISAMLSSLKKSGDIKVFYYKPVLDLVEYDKEHETELAKTLKEYLKHPKEIKEICENLSIHKNTLYKRLERIDSVMNCDYRDGVNIMKIELTFEMLEIEGGVL